MCYLTPDHTPNRDDPTSYINECPLTGLERWSDTVSLVVTMPIMNEVVDSGVSLMLIVISVGDWTLPEHHTHSLCGTNEIW